MAKTKKKEKWHPIIIGDVVEVQNCKDFGMARNKYRGVLIWRPMDQDKYTPQFYAIWLWNKFGTNEAEINKRHIEKKYNELDHSAYWRTQPWTYMLKDENVSHILYVPREYKENIKFIEHENPRISVGDYVLDRRWLCRFGQGNMRKVLAVKRDKYYDENRICMENSEATYLSFYNWVSTALRRHLIKISKTQTMELPEEKPAEKPNRLKSIFIRETA